MVATFRSDAEGGLGDAAARLMAEAVENISERIALYDADGRFVTCNRRYLELRGDLGPHLVAGKTFEEILRASVAQRSGVIKGVAPGEIEDWIQARLERFRQPGPAEFRHYRGERWERVQNRVTPSGGRVIIRAGVTEAKRAERELAVRERRNSEATLCHILKHVGDALFIIDPATHRILDVNQQACASLDHDRETLAAMTVPDIEVDFPREAFDAHVRSLTRNEVATVAGTHRHRDGTTFPVEVRVALTAIIEGREVILALARNVAEREAVESRLRHAQKMEAIV